MGSSESISASKFDDSSLESRFQSSYSPDRDQEDPPSSPPPQCDPDADTVDTSLLHGHLHQNVDLKDTDEKQNLGSESKHHDSQNLHLVEQTHQPQTQNFDVKETIHEAETTTGDTLEKAQDVDLEKTHHETRENQEEAGNDSNEEDNGESREENKNGNDVDKVGSDGDGDVLRNEEDERSNKGHPYPLRPDAEDCAYYMKTGACKFGSSCKFNHPLRRKINQAPKEKMMERGEELGERPGQTECKYYLRTGGCKFGKACRYHHPRGKVSVTPILELNFLGLPIRLGEKECPYYMRTGSCKYGSNCRFNHPDPTSTGGSDLSGLGIGGSVSLKGASPSTITSWTLPKTLKETSPFVPMMFQPTQMVPSQTPEWNGYQAPLYPPPETSVLSPPAYVVSPATETNIFTHEQQQMLLDEFPERPGQPKCSYYLKTGHCKFKSNCKYHHPKTQITRSPPCPLSDKGLPLRPDQNVCTHYSRYGICKFGPACKFDHPVHYQASTMTGFDQPPSYGNPMMGGSGSDSAIQQHV